MSALSRLLSYKPAAKPALPSFLSGAASRQATAARPGAAAFAADAYRPSQLPAAASPSAGPSYEEALKLLDESAAEAKARAEADAKQRAEAEEAAKQKAEAEAKKKAEEAAQAAPTVTVRSGDSLSAIAGRALGDAGRWNEIFELNRDQISNPGLIYAGQVLKLPSGANVSAPPPAPANGKWAWPVSGNISSPFGMRDHPITGVHKLHTGMDIAAGAGTSIKVPLAGTVTFAGWNGGYGNYVVVDHGNGLQTAYAHQSQILVSVGQRVNAGDVIGKVGTTGDSTGPHLHFEVKRNGEFVNPRDFLS